MRLFAVITGVVLSLVIVSQSGAENPGSIGTVECREEQLQIQATRQMDGRYKNHGQLVKRVAYDALTAKKAGLIDGKCAACILREFALGIPAEKQRACGPDTEPEACYLPDGSCKELTEKDCRNTDGAPQGPGTDCDAVPIVSIETVACCLPDDSCADMIAEECASIRGSTPMEFGSHCATVSCSRAY